MHFLSQAFIVAVAGIAAVEGRKHGSTCGDLKVLNDGQPSGHFKNISGIQIYHSYPPTKSFNKSIAIIYITDIYGIPLPQAQLLADSFAHASYPVIMPDLFNGDAVPVTSPERGLNLTEWSLRHPQADIDAVIARTIKYMREDLGVKRIGGVGYCFGGKYVPRFLAQGKGVDVGFIAHPSMLTEPEIWGVAGPITVAAGELDATFNSTLRFNAEEILRKKNATYQTSLYSGAPHGFGVRVDLNNSRQRYAKESAFFQAVRWFDYWL